MYLLHKLLKDLNHVCTEFEIEPVFICTKSLRRHLRKCFGLTHDSVIFISSLNFLLCQNSCSDSSLKTLAINIVKLVQVW